jgi:hypothetical protein
MAEHERAPNDMWTDIGPVRQNAATAPRPVIAWSFIKRSKKKPFKLELLRVNYPDG